MAWSTQRPVTLLPSTLPGPFHLNDCMGGSSRVGSFGSWRPQRRAKELKVQPWLGSGVSCGRTGRSDHRDTCKPSPSGACPTLLRGAQYLARWYGRLPSLAFPKGRTMCIFFFVFTPFFSPFAKIQPMRPPPPPICHHLSVPRHLFLISSSQHSAPCRHFIISNAGTGDGARLFSYGISI